MTGSTGFLGRYLLPALLRAGFHVRALVREPARYAWLSRCPQIEVVRGSLHEQEALRAGLAGARFVVHAAGLFRFWGDERLFEHVNVNGTAGLLHAARQAGIERFVHVSTIAVIGQPQPGVVIDEAHPTRPVDAYQRSKLRAEQLVLDYAGRGLDVIVLRPGAFYGPLGRYGFNRLFFQDPMRGLIMQVNGGRNHIMPIFIAGAADGVVRALKHGRAGEIYNLCDDSIQHRAAFDVICAEAGLRWPRLPVPGPLGIGLSQFLTMLGELTGREPFWPINLRSYVYNDWRVSSAKARAELGAVPTPFIEGARRTIAWYRAGMPDEIAETRC